jgi:hypothetical protein
LFSSLHSTNVAILRRIYVDYSEYKLRKDLSEIFEYKKQTTIMRVPFSIALTMATCMSAVSGFAPTFGITTTSTSTKTMKTKNASFSLAMNEASVPQCDEEECVIPDDLEEALVPFKQPGMGQLLRSAVLTNADGGFVRLDKAMGQGKSVVVFLRHLG